MLVEVCANSLESALNAQMGGADRVEICAELGVGGVTPSYGMLLAVKERLSIPVHVLIRPRSGDFTYSQEEFNIMKGDITLCAQLGFQGIVSGVLHKDGTLDAARTRELISLAGSMGFTFHRAFDWVPNPMETLKSLEDMGVHQILTSGQKQTALDGLPLLRKLQKQATTCSIMPGGGINEANALQFKSAGFKVIHLSGTRLHQNLDVAPPISMNTPNYLVEGTVAITQRHIIEKVVQSVI